MRLFESAAAGTENKRRASSDLAAAPAPHAMQMVMPAAVPTEPSWRVRVGDGKWKYGRFPFPCQKKSPAAWEGLQRPSSPALSGRRDEPSGGLWGSGGWLKGVGSQGPYPDGGHQEAFH